MSRISRWLRLRREKPAPPPPPTPFEHLATAPRREVRTEQLLGEPFQIPDAVSFYYSYRSLFLADEYRFNTENQAPRIVDCGANCGLTIVYFKQLYPAARIVALEPDPQIFRLLERNVAERRLADVTLLNQAVAGAAGHVPFHCEGADAGRIHSLDIAHQRIMVPAVALDQLLIEPVELLKLDIEGAETDVLCASRRLDRVSQIILEYHSFADTEQSLHRLLSKLADNGFRYYMQTQFCAKRPLVEDASYLGMDLQINIFAKRSDPAAASRAA